MRHAWEVGPRQGQLAFLRFHPAQDIAHVLTGRWASDGGGALQLPTAVRGAGDADPGWTFGVAEAAQLAIQEAAGRTGEFSRQGLKQAADDLATLQTLFVETLQDAAQNAKGVVQATFTELAEHARSSGSALGQRVKIALDQLTQAVTSGARILSAYALRDARLWVITEAAYDDEGNRQSTCVLLPEEY